MGKVGAEGTWAKAGDPPLWLWRWPQGLSHPSLLFSHLTQSGEERKLDYE